jgi:hypothetical protein
VKTPADSIKQIAKEYAAEHGISKAAGYIRNRVQRVETLLSAIH